MKCLTLVLISIFLLANCAFLKKMRGGDQPTQRNAAARTEGIVQRCIENRPGYAEFCQSLPTLMLQYRTNVGLTNAVIKKEQQICRKNAIAIGISAMIDMAKGPTKNWTMAIRGFTKEKLYQLRPSLVEIYDECRQGKYSGGSTKQVCDGYLYRAATALFYGTVKMSDAQKKCDEIASTKLDKFLPLAIQQDEQQKRIEMAALLRQSRISSSIRYWNDRAIIRRLDRIDRRMVNEYYRRQNCRLGSGVNC